MTYDAAGNRISDSKYSGGGTWTYDNLNRMEQSPKMSSTGGASPWSYTHDAMGNRLSRNFEAYGANIIQDDDIAIYEWDAVNRLLKTTNEGNGASFRYRADGLRVEKVSGLAMVYIQNEEDDSGFYDDNLAVNKPTTRWYYDGQMGMEDDYRTKPNLTLPDQYTVNRCGLGARGIDSISRYYGTPSSFSLQEVSYPVYDGHGNMVLTVRRNGSSFTTHDERRYDVWGSVRAGSGASSQRYCANLGHQQDDESGLIYMRARYYEPGSGRFISEDPARDGWNWFAYCKSNPTNYVDRSGCWATLALHAILFGVGFALGWAAGSEFWKFALRSPSSSGSKHMMMAPEAADAALSIYNGGMAAYAMGGLAELVEFVALTAGSASPALGAFLGSFGLGVGAGFLLSFYMGLLSAFLTDAVYVSYGEESKYRG